MDGKCKRCGAKIQWVMTNNGKWMPCEIKKQGYCAEGKGRQRIIKPNGEVIACEYTDDYFMQTGEGYVPHFVKCRAGECR